MSTEMTEDKVDVLVIGGGPAGLAAAQTIAASDPTASVLLAEAGPPVEDRTVPSPVARSPVARSPVARSPVAARASRKRRQRMTPLEDLRFKRLMYFEGRTAP